ncbi:uncharacterized protein K452DRAFT_52560 [Aplosporella prunicola CBS 121167]|uniref:Uncharacterized protein n=1 Tax=Aplosporella prunicola CBS 121167 TaxID=1176127 RepID=A0A6A6B8E6_9PEZI|nr:uncharacterized protein K452DRAFT_52560 [Aplosporella prunicola CBS 121167]KAF2140196.1 hypothetical protein K452DRAFT_52560 [Aplosporella prunicola CBS 121167]
MCVCGRGNRPTHTTRSVRAGVAQLAVRSCTPSPCSLVSRLRCDIVDRKRAIQSAAAVAAMRRKVCPVFQVVTASWERARRGPRDDGFKAGLRTLDTRIGVASRVEQTCRAGDDLSWWSWFGEEEEVSRSPGTEIFKPARFLGAQGQPQNVASRIDIFPAISITSTPTCTFYLASHYRHTTYPSADNANPPSRRA